MVRNSFFFQIAFGTIFIVLLLHSLLAVGFKKYYFDASLPSHEIADFHLLHQQVQSIEHSHARLEINSLVNNSMMANEAEVQQMKVEKSKEDNKNIGKKENDAVTGMMKEINATMIPTNAAKILKPV